MQWGEILNDLAVYIQSSLGKNSMKFQKSDLRIFLA